MRLPEVFHPGAARFVALETLIVMQTKRLFPGYAVKGQGLFRIGASFWGSNSIR